MAMLSMLMAMLPMLMTVLSMLMAVSAYMPSSMAKVSRCICGRLLLLLIRGIRVLSRRAAKRNKLLSRWRYA